MEFENEERFGVSVRGFSFERMPFKIQQNKLIFWVYLFFILSSFHISALVLDLGDPIAVLLLLGGDNLDGLQVLLNLHRVPVHVLESLGNSSIE